MGGGGLLFLRLAVARKLWAGISLLCGLCERWCEYFEVNFMMSRRGVLRVGALGATSLAVPLVHSNSAVSPGGVNNGVESDRSQNARHVDYLSLRSGAESQSVAGKLDGVVSIKDFGAIGDGLYHPVSEWFTVGCAAYRGYNNLAEVCVDYPHVSSQSQSIDWVAIQAALNSARASACMIDLHDLFFIVSDTLIWKGGGVSMWRSGALRNQAYEGR